MLNTSLLQVKSHACFQGDMQLVMKSLIILTRSFPESFLLMLESCTYEGNTVLFVKIDLSKSDQRNFM